VLSTLVCDSGVVYAGLDGNDSRHGECAALLEEAAGGIVIPALAVVEVDWLGQTRGRHDAAARLIASVDDGTAMLADLDIHGYRRVRHLIRQYASLPLDIVDASVIAIAERLEETTIATLDRRHFSIVRPLHCEAFTLVP